MENLRLDSLAKEAAVSQERNLLARELHDSIAQSLAFLKIQVQLMRDALASGNAQRMQAVLGEIDAGVRESYGDVRELLVHFRTRANAEHIEPALQTTLRKFEHQSGIKARLPMQGQGLPLSPDVQIQVLHIVQEALSNVRKHARASQVWLDVQQQPRWRFEVRDDGIGFDADDRRPRRDPCRPAHHDRARRAHRRHAGGDLHAGARQLGGAGAAAGAVLTAAAAQTAPTPPRQPALMTRATNGRPVRILVVDDHTLFRRGLTALLSRDASLQVVGDAADAGEAQRRAAELQPDLILLDNHLPGVNGVDALPALRQAAPQARIVMLTVSEDEADLAAALRGGACGYLLKTIEGDALVTAIHRAMRGASVVAEEMTDKLVAAYRDAAAPSRGRPRRRRQQRLAHRPAVTARARHPARHRSRCQQQGDRPRSRHRRDHGEDPRAARAAQARRQLARAGRGGGHGTWAVLTQQALQGIGTGRLPREPVAVPP